MVLIVVRTHRHCFVYADYYKLNHYRHCVSCGADYNNYTHFAFGHLVLMTQLNLSLEIHPVEQKHLQPEGLAQ